MSRISHSVRAGVNRISLHNLRVNTKLPDPISAMEVILHSLEELDFEDSN